MHEPAIIVGAGPAGLATAAMLRRRGIDALVLERNAAVGGAWRGRYDTLRLHTVRQLSNLPGTPLPRTDGRFVSRDAFVHYLEGYAGQHAIRMLPETDVRRIGRSGAGFRVITAGGPITTAAVVVATGYCHTPAIPRWPGRGSYPGRLLHSSEYRNATPFRDQRVLVVGAGNSGSDIALDLARAGASAVWVSVRTPPQIVPREVLGLPAQFAGIALRRAPAPLADAAARLERRVFIGDLSDVGLPAPPDGLFSRHRRAESLPILDFGFAAGARRGAFRVVAAVEAFEGKRVLLGDGTAVAPDVVIAATGFATGLEPLVGDLDVLDAAGRPLAHGGESPAGAPGLWFTGFRNPISGALRELRFEAPAIAQAIGSSLTHA